MSKALGPLLMQEVGRGYFGTTTRHTHSHSAVPETLKIVLAHVADNRVHAGSFDICHRSSETEDTTIARHRRCDERRTDQDRLALSVRPAGQVQLSASNRSSETW